MRHDWTQRVISSSTSDMQSAVDPRSRVVCHQQVPVPQPQVNSLTRSSTRAADERLAVWTPNTTMAASMPSIPRGCVPNPQNTGEPTVNSDAWLDSLRRQNNAVQSMSQSTDRMMSLNHTGDGFQSLGTLGRHSVDACMTPSRSTLVGSDESFAVSEASCSRQSLTSRGSVSSSQNGRRDSSSSSKKRRVRFELQSPSVQSVPDQRQRSRARSDKGQTTVGEPAADPAADDHVEGRSTSRASGSIFSKFRRVVAGALFGHSKQKNNADSSSENVPSTSSGHLRASSFEDMTEMERLASVADRIASERLHSAVLHGRLPTSNGCRGASRSYGCPDPSLGDLDNIEAGLAGLSISSGITPQPEQLPNRKQQDLASWCGHGSSSVSEELCRLPSNACSSYVQFMPKSTTVPCSMGSASAIEPRNSCLKQSAFSSMGNMVVIECQCGGWPMTESEPVLPTTDSSTSSRMIGSQPGDVYSSENRLVQRCDHPYAEPSTALKSASQPTMLNSHGPMYQHSSVSAAPKQEVEFRRSTSDDASAVREKPEPPPKVFLRSSSTPYREGLLPTPAGVEDFRIRRQVAVAGHGAQNGPMKATVPVLQQLHTDNPDRNLTRLPPPPPPPRSFAAADVRGLSTESDTEAQRLTLQKLSALVDRELRANERLEMDADLVQAIHPLNPTSDSSIGVSNHVDSFKVVSSSACGRKPAAQSKDDVDAKLKSLGFDEAIWNIGLDEVLGGSALVAGDDDDEDSASTITDCSGSVETVTSTPRNRRRATSPIPRHDDRLQPSNDAVSGCGSAESIRSVDDPFSRLSKPSALGTGSSYSLPAISDVRETRPADGDPAHPRCSSTNIPLPRTCREDVIGRWRLPVAFSFNQLASGTPTAATSSPYNSKSSGIGSLFDSGSVPNSPL